MTNLESKLRALLQVAVDEFHSDEQTWLTEAKALLAASPASITTSVTRYTDGGPNGWMQSPTGEFVRYEDYERLLRQIAQSCHDARSDPEFGGCPVAVEPPAPLTSVPDNAYAKALTELVRLKGIKECWEMYPAGVITEDKFDAYAAAEDAYFNDYKKNVDSAWEDARRAVNRAGDA